MEELFTLSSLLPGESCRVGEVRTDREIHRRFLDIGLVKNATVTCLGRSPLGDPSAYMICGAVIAIREKDAACILVYR